MPRIAHACSDPAWGRPRQTKEQQGTERIDIAAHARLAKTILLGRCIGTRAKLNGIGIGSLAPHASDSQVDNHQR